MNRIAFLFLYFILLNACSKESPLQPIEYELGSELAAAKVACDSLDHASDHVKLDSLLAVIDSLTAIGDSLAALSLDSLSSEGFSFELVFIGEFSVEEQASINQVTDRWEEIVVGDIPNTTLLEPFELIINGPPYRFTYPLLEIDDHVVFIKWHDSNKSTNSMDYEILKLSTEGFPVISSFSINSDSYEYLVEQELFFQFALHTIGHNLGFVSSQIEDEVDNLPIWDRTYEWERDYIYKGPNSINAFFKLLTDSKLFNSVPELDGVPIDRGPRGRTHSYIGHWRGKVFKDELMSGAYEPGYRSPVSKLTIALMEDLGYEVNYESADEYELDLSGRGDLGPLSKPVVQGFDANLKCGHPF